MEKYRLVFKKPVSKDFQAIPNKDVKRILARIEKLIVEPRGEGCIKLSGQNTYRVRQGLYRIIYEIRDKLLIINVIKVGHRSDVYKSK